MLPLLSADRWLRVSIVLAHLLLAGRVPLPGFGDMGPFASFNSVEPRSGFRSAGERLRECGAALVRFRLQPATAHVAMNAP
ncbi:hypothetical protein ACFXKF_32480 [Streptomyces scopuliridis]|uniref:hypothetical protein n=1 Tax=Streptomyces scopuliridis TaxID=452529 RepID=UPI0036B18C6E